MRTEETVLMLFTSKLPVINVSMLIRMYNLQSPVKVHIMTVVFVQGPPLMGYGLAANMTNDA